MFCTQTDTLGMKHLNSIKKIVDEGQFEEAHSALEDLLEMGPKNVEAIKLKAALFAHVGRFDDEEAAWRRVIDIDNEDEDAIRYYQGAQLEDREHYYFTDVLPSGGRRYLAYPRALVSVSFIGLMGCVAFLALTRLSGNTFQESPGILFATFLATVVSPWFAIIYMYVKTIRSISLSNDGFEVSTRLRNIMLPWKEIDRLILAHSDDLESSHLRLVVLPKDNGLPPLSIDMTPETSAVRARKHLLAEMKDHFPKIEHEAMGSIKVEAAKLRRF